MCQFITLCLINLLFVFSSLQAGDGDKKPLSDVLKGIEKKHNVVFSYVPALVQNVRVNTPSESDKLNHQLDYIFAQTDLTYRFIGTKEITLFKKPKTNGNIEATAQARLQAGRSRAGEALSTMNKTLDGEQESGEHEDDSLPTDTTVSIDKNETSPSIVIPTPMSPQTETQSVPTEKTEPHDLKNRSVRSEFLGMDFAPTTRIEPAYVPVPLHAISINIISTRLVSIEGVEVGLIGNYDRMYVNGLQIAGGGNRAYLHARGLQIAGGSNQTGDLSGVQIATVNIADQTNGLQIGAVNISKKDHSGLQIGAGYNHAENVRGLQLASVNEASHVHGIQIALVNRAKQVHGAQIGLFNFADENNGIALGLLNFIRNGQHHGRLARTERGFNHFSYTHGSKYMYTIYDVAVRQLREPAQWALGGGIGAIVWPDRRLSLAIEATTHQHNKDKFWEHRLNMVNTLKITPTIKLHKHLSVYAGASANVWVSRAENGFPAPTNAYNWDYKHTTIRAWWGGLVGIYF
ncbi:MAG TPA: hypothetical protein PLL93_00355 [bacterium]|nr:hypothetical protein [bacterium]